MDNVGLPQVGLPQPVVGRVFIDVWNCRAVVSRYEAHPSGGITWAPAANADDLAEAAADAVEAAGGWLTASGHYPCPDDLAERAVFDDWSESNATPA